MTLNLHIRFVKVFTKLVRAQRC